MSSPSTPPRFVPTLTDVVQPETFPQALEAQPNNSLASSHESFEAQIVHRVMQRVDLVLERRLREAVGQVILMHIQSLGPRLREEIELVVGEAVSQAVAQELQPSPAGL